MPFRLYGGAFFTKQTRMEYVSNGKHYMMNYQALRDSYLEFTELSNDDFLKNLPEAIHLACIICYLKELKTYNVLSDGGVIHEIAHLMHIPHECNIDEVRELFNTQLFLAP